MWQGIAWSSHFSDVAKTDGIAYGVNACKSLAKKSPNKAIKNADSHEYFSEHNPKCLKSL